MYSIKKRFISIYRYSIKKGVLENFTNFTGQHLCQSLFLIKLQLNFKEHLLKLNFKEDLSHRTPPKDCF